jgi:phosphoribosylamine-glycine ligase
MTKRTFLFYNIGGDWEALALRIKAEGYPIYYYKRKGMTKGREETGVGLFEPDEMVDDIYECLNEFKDRKGDIVILMDDNGYGDEADYLRYEGWRVVGGSSWADEAEYDRSLGLDIMQSIGLDVPFEQDFESIDDALKFLETDDDEARYVFKPHGEDMAGSSRTYTAKNKQDLIDYLKWTKADVTEKHTNIGKFVLQEFVEGIEADFAGYFNGHDFIKDMVMIDIEEKKSGDGNKGAAVGCMGNVVLNVGKSKFFDKYMMPLTDQLRSVGYVGTISINNIFASRTVNKHKDYFEGEPYGLEFTPRFGWDAHLTEAAILKDNRQNLADFYIALADQDQFKFPVGKVGCGVRVYSGSIDLSKDDVQGRLFSFDKSTAKNLWFYSVSRKKGAFIIEDNPVLVVNTVGKNLNNTIADCYAILKDKLNVPDIYYRMEIGKRAEEVLKFLQLHGWI